MLAVPVILALVTGIPAEPPVQKVPVVLVYVNNAAVLKMSSGKFIKAVRLDVENVVEAVPLGTDPAAILLRGKNPGKVPVELTDKDGAKETFQILVARYLPVPLGVSLSWDWPAGQPIKSVTGHHLKVAHAKPDPADARRLHIEPLGEGECFLTLTDAAGKSETVGLVVRKPDRLIAVGESATFQTVSKKPIRKVIVSDERILQARVLTKRVVQSSGPVPHEVQLEVEVGNPLGVTVTGASPGLVQLRIIDSDDKPEGIWVGVKPKS